MKKNFCDGWDNAFQIIIPNILIDILLFAAMGLIALIAGRFPDMEILCFGCVLIFLMAASVLTLAWGECAAAIADFNTATVRDFLNTIRGCIRDGAAYGCALFILLALTAFAVPFYFRQGTFAALVAGCVFCWIALFLFLALAWYPAMRSLMHNGFRKCLKKCFIILFDNLGVSVFVTAYNFLLTLCSVICFGIIPGAAGTCLARVNALRLVLKKYDYLEASGEQTIGKSRRKIPWHELLKQDREALGTRSFKSFFMPWKE